MRYAFVALLFLASPAYSQYFSNVPNILVNAQTTDAGQLNDNFAFLVTNGNDVFNAFEVEIAAIGSASVPSGMVLPFNLAACPTGWLTANGTSGTVDMRGRFARAVTSGVGVVAGDQFEDHNQTVSSSPSALVNIVSTVQVQAGGSSVPNAVVFGTVVVGNPTTGRSGSESRPKNVALRYCEKS